MTDASNAQAFDAMNAQRNAVCSLHRMFRCKTTHAKTCNEVNAMFKRNITVTWDHAKDCETGERVSPAFHSATFEVIGSRSQLDDGKYLQRELGRLFLQGDVPNGCFAFRGTKPRYEGERGGGHGFSFWFSCKGEIEKLETRFLHGESGPSTNEE